jgi:hypothetical protein
MSIIGSFVLHLYCDDPRHATVPTAADEYRRHKAYSPGEYTGETRAQTVRTAKAGGWLVNQTAGTAICPMHRDASPRVALPRVAPRPPAPSEA